MCNARIPGENPYPPGTFAHDWRNLALAQDALANAVVAMFQSWLRRLL